MQKLLQAAMCFFRSLISGVRPSSGTMGSCSAKGTLGAKLIRGPKTR